MKWNNKDMQSIMPKPKIMCTINQTFESQLVSGHIRINTTAGGEA